MSNLIPLDKIQVPAHLAGRAANNDMFLAGLSGGGGFPTIGLKGTRFVVKQDGQETVLPTVEIAVVMLGARPTIDKNWYATKYDPNNSDIKAPDCFSRDGVRPDPSSSLKQAEACAGCPHNQFGSGQGADGSPSKGKACSDTKLIAIFANNGVYGLRVPPASLKAFRNYVQETSRRGVDLTTAITVVGFDPAFSFPVLNFNFGGFLAPEQITKIDSLKGTPEVSDIIGGAVTTPTQKTSETPASPPPPPANDPFAPMGDQPKAEAPKRGRKVSPINENAAAQVVETESAGAIMGEDDLRAALGLD